MKRETAADVVYEKPKITVYGDLTELTAGQYTGNVFDNNFHTGQPFQGNILSCVLPPPHGAIPFCITLPHVP
jgi:hypothetical protein